MKTISFINLKGGVGKTTIVTNAAFALANFWGARVLVIDNDKQGNASLFLGGDPKKASLANLLLGEATAKECIQPTRYTSEWFVQRRREQRKAVLFHDARIDVIVSDMGLMFVNYEKLREQESAQDDILKKALSDVADDYDVCLIDNPPDINISVLNALVASESVIIVSTPDAYSVQGVYEMVGMIDKEVRSLNSALRLDGVLINKFVASANGNAYVQEMEQKLHVFRQRIRLTRDKTDESTRLRKSIYEFSPQCGFAADLGAFLEAYSEGRA